MCILCVRVKINKRSLNLFVFGYYFRHFSHFADKSKDPRRRTLLAATVFDASERQERWIPRLKAAKNLLNWRAKNRKIWPKGTSNWCRREIKRAYVYLSYRPCADNKTSLCQPATWNHLLFNPPPPPSFPPPTHPPPSDSCGLCSPDVPFARWSHIPDKPLVLGFLLLPSFYYPLPPPLPRHAAWIRTRLTGWESQILE